MKKISFLILLFVGISTFAQKEINTSSKGFIADGYDVVAYFENKIIEGNKKLSATHKGIKYAFSSKTNLEKFKKSPEKFMPQYGGWCAYAMGAKNKKVDIDPETFEVRDGKLYLFYNSWGMNKLEAWKEGGTVALKKKADTNWKAM